MKTLFAGVVAGIIAMGANSSAQEAMPRHGHVQHGHAAHAMPGKQGDASPSSAAFRAANEKMHRDMNLDLTGDADVDFVRGMIPHHQGAIDMAKIELAFGKDPEIRKLAEDIVKAQEAEIAMMKEWLAKRGK